MHVKVTWTQLTEHTPHWDYCGCLYAYVDSESGEVLYIGKADYHSVGQRLSGRHKENVFRYFRRYGVRSFDVIHGQLWLEEGRRFSRQLLADVESLLINRLLPPANIACTKSRISRPGMRVTCSGDWPDRRRRFHDSRVADRFA